MAIAKKPDRNLNNTDRRAAKFIAGAGISSDSGKSEASSTKEPTMIRIPSEIRARIDQAAKRLGISRSGFLVQSAVEKMERMDVP
jgi:hypothetical protein